MHHWHFLSNSICMPAYIGVSAALTENMGCRLLTHLQSQVTWTTSFESYKASMYKLLRVDNTLVQSSHTV